MRLIRILGLALSFLIPLMVSPPAASQVSTSQQLEMLRSLSPAAREQVLNQLAGSSDAETPNLDAESRDVSGDEAAAASDEDTRELSQDRRLAAGDTVLIAIDYLENQPARTQILGEGLPTVVIPEKRAPEYSKEERDQLDKLIGLSPGSGWRIATPRLSSNSFGGPFG